MNKLTLDRLDSMLDRAAPPRPKVIWTASAIGRRIGTSADFVRDRLSKEPGSPVKLVGGRYCVLEDELMKFFRPAV